jgi:hypothetical protein
VLDFFGVVDFVSPEAPELSDELDESLEVFEASFDFAPDPLVRLSVL